MKSYLCTNILWDTDDDQDILDGLPKSVLFFDVKFEEEDAFSAEDYLRDALSDEVGFCHFGFDFNKVENPCFGDAERIVIPKGMTETKLYDGAACPKCGGKDIVAGNQENHDVKEIAQNVSCENCGSSWVEFYKLTGYDFLESPEESTEG